jgi:hypothetical protein
LVRRSEIEPQHIASGLPELDRTNDPRGGAVAWALLMVGAVSVLGTIVTIIGVW